MDKKELRKLLIILVSVVVALVISQISPPSPKLGPASMRFMGIFVAMLILLITQVMADWVIMLIVMAACVIFNVGTLQTTFAAFSQSTVWLVIGVLTMALGIANSGLMTRISAKIMSWAPSSYPGMVGAMMITGLILTPLIASTTAKATLLGPLTSKVTEQAGLKERSRAAVGLFTATFMMTYIVGNAFLSGSANVGIMMGFMKLAKPLSWTGWFAACSIWFIMLVVGTYLFCVIYCKPKEGEMREISKEYFKENLKALGPITMKEKLTAVIIVLSLVGWITSSITKLDAGMVALVATALLAIIGVFNVTDFTAKTSWNLIVFVGALLGVASFLQSLGIGTWLASLLGPFLSPMVSNPWIFIPVICIASYLIRTVVISQLASLAIALAIFGPLMPAAGISMFILVFVWYMTGNIWNTNYQNPVINGVVAAAGNKYVQFEDFRVASVLYMILCIVGFTASIPLWRLIGLIQ